MIQQKIYRAIKKGLNEALANLSVDDFDDVEFNYEGEKTEDIETHSGTDEYNLWKLIKNDFVDLGLPSGTLWAKCNLGANTPEEAGNYYAWGEIEPKQDYSWHTYKYGKASDELTKYTVDGFGKQQYSDDIDTLLPEDDAASVINSHMHIPTFDQIFELEDLPSEWIISNGICGRRFTGKNGNSIFIPARGYMDQKSLEGNHIPPSGCIWSNQRNNNTSHPRPYFSYYFGITNKGCGVSNDWRREGMNIRPVIDRK